MTVLVASLIASAVVAIFPGKFAQRKGRRFWPWWLFGFVAFIPALIAVALVSDTGSRRSAKRDDEATQALYALHASQSKRR